MKTFSYCFDFVCYRNTGEIQKDTLKNAKIFILAGSHEKFTEDEFKHVKVRRQYTGKPHVHMMIVLEIF